MFAFLSSGPGVHVAAGIGLKMMRSFCELLGAMGEDLDGGDGGSGLRGDFDLVVCFEMLFRDGGFEGGEEFTEFVGVAGVDGSGVAVDGNGESLGEAATPVGTNDELGVLDRLGVLDFNLKVLRFSSGGDGGFVGIATIEGEGAGGL